MTVASSQSPILEFLRSRGFVFGSLILLFGIMLLVYLSAEHRAIGGFGYGLDDSWIHATIARNLVEGRGFGFNPGEPVSGSTAPLYTVLLGGWYLLFREVVWGGKILGMIGVALTALFAYLSVLRIAQDRFIAWLAAALCLASPALLFSGLNGMETGLYLVTPVAALYLYLIGRYNFMITVLALGVWMRPEAVLLLAMGWLAVPARKKLIGLAIGAAFILPYFAFNYALSGYPLPNTVRSKAHLQAGFFDFNVLRDLKRLLTIPHVGVQFLLVPLGAWVLWKRAWWAAIFPFAFFVAIWATSEGLTSLGRYMYPALPFLFVMVALGFSLLLRKIPTWRWAWIAAAVILLISQGYKGIKMSATHAGAVENITHMQVDIAQTLGQATLPSDTIATNDIGALGYFSGRYVLDLMGLVNPYRSLEENLRRYRPAELVIFDSWFPDRMQSPTFVSQYVELVRIGLTRNFVCGDSVMTIYVRHDRYEDLSNRIAAIKG